MFGRISNDWTGAVFKLWRIEIVSETELQIRKLINENLFLLKKSKH